MSYQQMMSGGILWIEQRAYIDGRDEIGIRDGLIAAKDAEIKSLREIANSVSILAGKIQVMDERQRELLRNRASSDRPFLVGYYEPRGQTFIAAASRTAHPDLALTHHIPVYVLPEP